jgi:periplasmic divalent cation tolerance protein
MTIVYVTCKDEKEAVKISNHLIEKHLIACANLFPIKSIYRWKGKLVNDNETVIIAKTTNKNFKKVENEIKKIHSYETPCILKINASSNIEYDNWVKKEIKKPLKSSALLS